MQAVPAESVAPVTALRRFWTVRSYLVALVLTVAAPFIGLIVYSTFTHAEEAARQAREQALRIAEISASHVERSLAESDSLLRALAQNQTVRSLNRSRLRATLSDLQVVYPHYMDLIVADRNGRLVEAVLPLPPGGIVAEGPNGAWFRAVMRDRRFTAGSPLMADRHRPPFLGRWVSMLAYPLMEGGEPAGAIGLVVDLARFQTVREANLPSGGTLTILDSDGNVVAREPDPARWVGKNARNVALVQTVLAQRRGHLVAPGLDDVERIYGFTPVRSVGWYVYAGIPTEAAYAPVGSFIWRSSVSGAAIVLMVVALAGFVGRRIVKPVEQLAAAARQAEKRLDVEAPVSGPREVAEATAGFNAMLDARRSVEADREEAVRRVTNILENMTDAFVHVNPNWEFTYVNSKAAHVLGKVREEMIGRNFWEVLPDSVGRDYSYSLLECMREQKEAVLEAYYPNNDAWYEVHLYPGDGLAIYFHDITVRKRASEEIAKSEASLRRLLDSNPIGVIVADFSGRIQYANDAFLRIVGYSHEDVRSGLLRWDAITPPEDAPKDRQAVEELRATGRIAPWEKNYIHQHGHKVPVLVGVTVLEEGKEDCVAFVLDLSLQKAQEEVRRKNQELEEQNVRIQEANRLKSEFLAHMSHELRTPLNGIIGYSEFLLDEKPGPLNEKQQRCLNDMLYSGRHLLQLINDVLDLAKVEAGRMELHPERFSVREAVAEVCSVLGQLSRKNSVTIRTEVAPEVDRVLLDQQKFKQVLYNLLSNAVKFSREGGTVDMDARRFDRTRLELRVRDTGIGIRREDFSRLFREFEQLEQGAGRNYGGSGLGLALARRIVEFQQGSIGVESVYGQGSTFTVVLPLESPPVAPFEPMKGSR